MSTMRINLTTYLNTPEQQEDWELVKLHYGNIGDAATMRELIRNKANDVRTGNTKRQALDEIRHDLAQQSQEIQALRSDVDSIKHLLRVLCQKVGVTSVEIASAGAAD